MVNKNYTIYKHTFPNNKIYIGITQQKPEKRWQHGLGYITQPLMWNAIQKYGWENIKHEILFENLTLEEANLKEIELINEYKCDNSRYGYNIRSGGLVSQGWHHSKETKEKLSKINIGKSTPDTTGMHFPRLKIYQYDLNGNLLNIYDGLFEASNATGVSQAVINCCINGKQKYNIKTSSTFSKFKLSKQQVLDKIKHKLTRAEKQIYQYNKHGDLITIYKSLIEIRDTTTFNKDTVQGCCKGHSKTYMGFVWSYFELTKEQVQLHYKHKKPIKLQKKSTNAR